MSDSIPQDPAAQSPLEGFLRDYVETQGGVWDEVEPQVYDVLLPGDGESLPGTDSRGVLRVTFDPEALPEHPTAQLASFGTPLIDRLLAEAMQRGRFAHLYLVGLNLTPHDVSGRTQRAFTLAEGQQLRADRIRPLHFTQAVYFFEATFISDQKEQEIAPLGLDLHYGRENRHLDRLLNPAHLSDRPAQPLAEARRLSLAAGYPIARARILPTVASMANTRSRELDERLHKQIARMSRYYQDMREELEESARRARNREEAPERLAGQREALDREARMRTAELRQKNSLRVQLRLLNLVVVQQPKLLLHAEVVSEKASAPLQVVWDLLTEGLEAPPCPNCGRPGFALGLNRQGRLTCPACPREEPGRVTGKR